MYKLRIKIFLGALVAVLLVLTGKLVHLQGIRGEDYRRKAEEAMRSVQVLPVIRGKITDRKGRILAIDEPCFDFCLHYRFLTGNKRWVRRQKRLIARSRKISEADAAILYEERSRYTWTVARELAREANLDLDEEVRRVVDRVQAVRRIVNRGRLEEVTVRDEVQAHPVVAALDEARAMALKGEAGQMIGVEVRSSDRRWYPYGPDACHVIGLTGKVWPEEMKRLNLTEGQADWLTRVQANYLPGDRIGKIGAEKMAEKVLRGRRGYRRFRLSGETLGVHPSVQGCDVHLTLDIVLQKRIAALLEAKGFTGSAVVLSIGTPAAPECEVLALVSVPTYDLNTYPKDYPKLLADEVKLPLMHRAVVQRYQPGSTVKPIAALAALGDAAITLHTRINCRGYLYSPDAFRCWIWKKYKVGHDFLDVVEGLQHSCNVFFYEVGNRVGARRMCEWFSMMGFAEKPGTGLPSERPGTVPTLRWLMARHGRNYRPSDARFMAIGQGLLTATPVHLANAMATIARDGVSLTPMLALEGAPRQVRRDLPLNPTHLQAVREGLQRVVNHRRGGAWKYFHGEGVTPLDGIEVCGKTGTATTAPQRVDSNRNGRIDLQDRIVRKGDTAWFVGFAPYGRPQIAFAVAVEYVSGGGGAIAGPIARETVRRYTSWPIIAAMIALMVFGLLAIDVSETADPHMKGFARKQLIFTGLGLFAFVAATVVPYQVVGRLTYPLFALTLGLLVLVLFLPAIRGSHRWIDAKVILIQPSEVAKISFIVLLAWYLRMGDHYRKLTGLAIPFVLTFVPMGLILIEPDLGTALLFLPTLYIMLFMAGAKLRHLLGIVAVGTAVLLMPVPHKIPPDMKPSEVLDREALAYWGNHETGRLVSAAPLVKMKPHQIRRILGWIRQDQQRIIKGVGYQLHQSKMVLGAGCLLGQGKKSRMYEYFRMLPDDHTDFIFSVVGGRWGLAGCLAVLFCYAVMFVFGIEIAVITYDPFARLLAVGVLALLFSQIFINVGMTMGLMPITGMTLPLVSYGGSSLMVNCAALGLLVSVGQRRPILLGKRPFEFGRKKDKPPAPYGPLGDSEWQPGNGSPADPSPGRNRGR
jgi:cell division protein FtsI/penicillin-binding protein 2